ncbi:hypothetical protein A4G99_20385 [Haladaptatus sp. R4]|nr:hypothetical protein A4G99_20385 [Haladaptatus sp. R4]
MKGQYAFCPKSGAPLSENVHYDELGRSSRHVVSDDSLQRMETEGEMTNGSLRSSKIALFSYFKRCYERHYAANSKLYSRSTIALGRLKRTASGRDAWDMYVWYALAERLARLGFDAEWMNAHIEPRCPQCSGRLKYEQLACDEIIGICGTDCTDDRSDRLEEIRETVADLYSRAFAEESGEQLSADDLVRL